jgi:hypothetical protein
MKKLFILLGIVCIIAGCGGGGGTANKGINIAQYKPDAGGSAMSISIKGITVREKYYFPAPFVEFGTFALFPVDNEGNQILHEQTEVAWIVADQDIGYLENPAGNDRNLMQFRATRDGQTTVTATRLDTGESATTQIVVFPALQLDYNQQGIGRGIVLSEKRQTYLEREADIWLAADRKSIVIPGGYVKSSDWEMGLEWLENPTLDASQIGTDTILTSDIYYQNPYLIRDKNGDVWAIYGSRRGFAFNKISE